MSENYDQLVARLQGISDLRHAEAVLEWDQQTNMPPKGNDARSRQMALLTALAHQKASEDLVGELISNCEAEASLDDEQKALVREARRDYDKAVKVPADLVREIAETSGKAHMVWVEARKENDFAKFAPLLEKLVELKKREAEALGYASDGSPYDALLDQFEPGATTKQLDPVLSKTRDIIVPAVKAITESDQKPDINIILANFDVEGQKKFSKMVVEDIGYDFEAGRLDEAVHPFTTSFDINDVRITTRYDKNWLPGALFGSIHEAGHALYELGLNQEKWGTPLASALSLGFHESQSRFWENQIGRGLPFWRYYYPKLQQVFPEALKNVSLKDFHFAINNVTPTFIRVEADEVTYNLHIIVRYEIEKALFEGSVKVSELPELWNDKMEAYLGIRPDKDSHGVLQDIHWSFGGFGYFPTYLLGNLYSAQWMSALKKDINVDAEIERGNFLRIRNWLKEKIHQHGRRYTANELTEMISGETLNAEHFGDYLKERFQKLYNVSW